MTAKSLYEQLVAKWPALKKTIRLGTYADVEEMGIYCKFPCVAKAKDGELLYNDITSEEDEIHSELQKVIDAYDEGRWIAEGGIDILIYQGEQE